MDEVNKLHWKLYTQLVPEWQERYMERLLQEYAGIIAETDHASNRFWKLRQHRTIAECAACLFFSSHICRKSLEIRQDSGGFCNKSGRKIPAQSAHLYYAVLP